MTSHLKKHKEFLILILLLLAFVVIPLLLLRIPSGHDYKYHMGRIWQIANNINHGKWFAPLYYGQINGYGYASPLFYGDVLLHLPAVAVSLGMSVEAALRGYIILCLCASAVIMFFCMKKMTGSPASALVSSVLYTFSSYLCIDFITRVALGEVQAFVFMPIAFTGLYSVLYGDKKDWLMLPLGLGGVLISHTLSAVVLAIFFFISALLCIPELIRDKRRMALIVVSALLFFGLTAFYVFPMLEQMNFGSLRLTDGTTDTIWGTLAERSMTIWQTIGDFNLSSANETWIPNGVGFAIPFVLAVMVVLIVRRKKVSGIAMVCGVFVVWSLFAASNLFPWDSVQGVFGKLQFPWRLLAFATLFGAICAGFVASAIQDKRILAGFIVTAACISLFSYSVTASPKLKIMINNEKNNVVLNEDWQDSLGGAEYLPSGTPWGTMIKNGGVVYTNDVNIRRDLEIYKGFDGAVVQFLGKASEDAYLKLPFIMYKGYEAFDQNGRPIALRCERGYVIADIGGIENGTVTVRYVGTAIQTASKILSLLTLLGLIIYINRVRLRKTVMKPFQSYTHRRENGV